MLFDYTFLPLISRETDFHSKSVNVVFRTDFIIEIIVLCWIVLGCQSPWLRGLKRGTAAARIQGLRVRILPGKDVCPLWFCVLSGRGYCFGLITRPEKSHRVWCVWVWSWSLDRLTRGGQTIKRVCGCLVYVVYSFLFIVYSCLCDTHTNNFMF